MINMKYFCIQPWVGAHIEANGIVQPCCASTNNGNEGLGSLHDNSLEEVLNSDASKDLRRAHLEGGQHELCKNCYLQESAGHRTMRNYYNEEYQGCLADSINATNEDGSLSKIILSSLDIKFSNLCNFKCRTCYAGASTSWYVDSNKLFQNKNFNKVLYPAKSFDELLLMLDRQLVNIKELYIQGGESLLEKNHYDFLDKLLEKNLTEIKLKYSTNLSVLSLGDRSILDYWSKFKNLTLLLSYDGIGAQGEFIRKGMSWKKVVENHKLVQVKLPHAKLCITPTISVLNAYHLPLLLKFLADEKMIESWEQVGINILEDPKFFNIRIFNINEKENLKKLYLDFIHNVAPSVSVRKKEHLASFLNSIINYIENNSQIDNLAKRKKFVSYNLKLNLIRNENLLALFPELEGLYLDAASSVE